MRFTGNVNSRNRLADISKFVDDEEHFNDLLRRLEKTNRWEDMNFLLTLIGEKVNY